MSSDKIVVCNPSAKNNAEPPQPLDTPTEKLIVCNPTRSEKTESAKHPQCSDKIKKPSKACGGEQKDSLLIECDDKKKDSLIECGHKKKDPLKMESDIKMKEPLTTDGSKKEPPKISKLDPPIAKKEPPRPVIVAKVAGKPTTSAKQLTAFVGKPAKDLLLGTASGWTSGYLLMKVGRPAAFVVGGGLIISQVAHQAGLTNIDWNKIKAKAQETTKTIQAKPQPQMLLKARQFARANPYFTAGFIGGFLIGVAI